MYTSPTAQSFPLSDLNFSAVKRPTHDYRRTVHLRIKSPKVCQKLQKEFIPLYYRKLGEYRECRPHISTRSVRGICGLQLVKRLLKGRLSAS